MNVFQIQETLRSMPDDYLMREMQQPTGTAPQYLILTEINRRQQLRSGMGAQMPTTTVAQDMMAGMGGQPQAPGGQTPPMVPQVAQMPGDPSALQPTSGGISKGVADQSSSMPPAKGFADGGMVEARKPYNSMVDKPSNGIFNMDGPLGPFGMLSPIGMIMNQFENGGDWGFGAIGLMHDLFNKKKKPGEIQDPQLPGQVPAQPMQPGFSGGGIVGYADGDQGRPVYGYKSLWDQIVGNPKEVMHYDVTDLLGKKPPVKKEPEKAAPKPAPNVNLEAAVAPPQAAQITDNMRILNRLRGPESRGGQDLNSIASNGKYFGPNQMYEKSYKDGRDAYLRMHPNANIPEWDPKWAGSKEGKRPKGYPTKEQWDMVGEGFVHLNREHVKALGLPESDGLIYGSYNIGRKNFKKIAKRPDVPIGDILDPEVVSDNFFNPKSTFRDLAKEWEQRMITHGGGPAPKAVQQTPSKKFFYVPEDEDLSMSDNPMIDGMFSSNDFYDELGSMLDQVAEKNKEQLLQQNQAKFLSGVGSYLQEPLQAQRAMRQIPAPLPKPQMQAPQRRLSAEDDKLASDILNDMQLKSLQAQRARKARQGFSGGGVVGYADGDGGRPVGGDTVVIKGKVYKLNEFGVPVDENGVPIINKAGNINSSLSETDDFIKRAASADKYTSKMMELDPLSKDWALSDEDTGGEMIAKVFGQMGDSALGAGRVALGGIGNFANALTSAPILWGRDVNNWLSYNKRDMDTLYGRSKPSAKPTFVGSPLAAPEPEQGPKMPDFQVVDPSGTTGTGINQAPSNPAATLSSITDYYNQLQKMTEGKQARMEEIMNDLHNRLSPDKERDRWMAIADFGGKLASGSSPYFAQNFGPAAQAGIASMRSDRDTAYDNALKMINARNMQYQTEMGRDSNLLNNAVNMYQADKSYKRAIEVANIQMKKAVGDAKLRGAAPDPAAAKMAFDAAKETMEASPEWVKMTTQEKIKWLADLNSIVAANAVKAGLIRDSRAVLNDDSPADFTNTADQ